MVIMGGRWVDEDKLKIEVARLETGGGKNDGLYDSECFPLAEICTLFFAIPTVTPLFSVLFHDSNSPVFISEKRRHTFILLHAFYWTLGRNNFVNVIQNVHQIGTKNRHDSCSLTDLTKCISTHS